LLLASALLYLVPLNSAGFSGGTEKGFPLVYYSAYVGGSLSVFWNTIALAVDIVFWFTVSVVILVAYKQTKSNNKMSATASKVVLALLIFGIIVVFFW